MIRLALIGITAVFCISGCVNPGMSTVQDSRSAPTYRAPKTSPVPVQPRIVPDSYRSAYAGKAYSLSLNNANLVDVLKFLSKESSVSIVPERGLNDTVSVEAHNKKLGELLYTILKPLGYTATVEKGIIFVGKPKLSTRTFRVNYLKDKRNSTSNMNVSGFSTGSVSVSTEGKSDFWAAIEDSLELMVFGTSGKGRREGGGYIRGDDLSKVVAESRQNFARQSGSSSNSTTSSNRQFSRNNGSSTVDQASSQIIEPAEPETREQRLADNKLKQLLVNEIAGIIQVTDVPENLDKISAFLADVEEGSKRQVLIQAHIMEVTLKDSFSMGIDWKYILDKTTNLTLAQALVPSNPTNVFKISAAGSDFGVLLDAMKEQGNVNMLSSPKISALNNQKAVIKLTTKQVSWVSSKTSVNSGGGTNDTFTTSPQVDEVGIFLDVTPQIGPDNSVTMQIHPSVSEVKEISTSPDKTSTKPVIDVREIDTMVDARAGETIVIAGLISDKLNETKRGIPLMSDIPYLGALFSYSKQERTKTELVIMMTPYILNTRSIDEIRAEHEQRLQDLGGDFHLINNLGSMITEKSSRDWIMRSEPHRLPQPEPAPTAARKDGAAAATADQPAVTTTITPPVTKPALAPEAKADDRPARTRSTTAPETAQQIEQQRATIKRLEHEAADAREHLKQERLQNETRISEERLAADAARQAQLKKIEELQNGAMAAPVATSAGVPAQPVFESPPVAAVRTVTVTTDREELLYRRAVTAYKTANCTESTAAFDAFIKAYPTSPLVSDAAYYLKDCQERLSTAPAAQ